MQVMLPVEVMRHCVVSPLIVAHCYGAVKALTRVCRTWRDAADVKDVHRRHRDYMAPFVTTLLDDLLPRCHAGIDSMIALQSCTGRTPYKTCMWLSYDGNQYSLRLWCQYPRAMDIMRKIDRYSPAPFDTAWRPARTTTARLLQRQKMFYERTFAVRRADDNQLRNLVYDLLMMTMGGHEVRQRYGGGKPTERRDNTRNARALP